MMDKKNSLRGIGRSITIVVAVHLVGLRSRLDLRATTASSSTSLGVVAHAARKGIAKLSTIPGTLSGVWGAECYVKGPRRCVGKAANVVKVCGIGSSRGSRKRRVFVDVACHRRATELVGISCAALS